ncbi:p protein [Caerostris extrusa]|uniref:P protein n=1 Tax=Caerostris extrusa TaxID=172846 RepID=A0AAV4Y8X6_CAEEX|nr:p protein [Caerostris extrusa]
MNLETHAGGDTSSLPRPETVVVVPERDMVNILSGLNMRKLTSGSSSGGSSEVTPLLNGSQEGPCYAYSSRNRDEEGELVDSTSTVRSTDDTNRDLSRFHSILKTAKLVFLSAVMIFCVCRGFLLSFIKVHDDSWNSIAISRGTPVRINVTGDIAFNKETIHLRAKGPFLPGEYYGITQDFVSFSVAKITLNGTYEAISSEWRVLLAAKTHDFEVDTKLLKHDFILQSAEMSDSNAYQVTISTNKRRDIVSLSVDVSVRPKLAVGHIIMALCVLVGLYVMIIFELVHRTLAAMIGATVAISCLALTGVRPSMMEILTWMDVETLSLLFGMMVLVSILCETGFFDYVAVLTYKLARGQIWALITGLCLVTAILSAFLDNVTTILLMSAVVIRLCEAMNIDPKHMLIAMVVFSNIGGAMTPIGDPPNVIIISNKKIQAAGIGFGDFTLHMLPVIVVCVGATYALLRIIYRDITTLRFTDPPEVVELKHEIEVWKKAFNSLSGYSRDEDTVRAILHRKITVLETLLRKKLYDAKISEDDYRASLKELTNTVSQNKNTVLLRSNL